jgi:hypothetical protein
MEFSPAGYTNLSHTMHSKRYNLLSRFFACPRPLLHACVFAKNKQKDKVKKCVDNSNFKVELVLLRYLMPNCQNGFMMFVFLLHRFSILFETQNLICSVILALFLFAIFF